MEELWPLKVSASLMVGCFCIEATVIESGQRSSNFFSSGTCRCDYLVALKDEQRRLSDNGTDGGGGELSSSCLSSLADIIAIGDLECTLRVLPAAEWLLSRHLCLASMKEIGILNFFACGLVLVSATKLIYSTFFSLLSSSVLNYSSSVLVFA